ncbi:ribonuclease R [Cytophagales bacterium LB-30]|uniref:Ribonuclease R n=1 Tax=Shiella aurantiaca TaxID=3058365 RepID=A0ABT8F6D6_9BACT|nr:ribonuclease R [Shiella aurantiaca]MDN4166033.1 ribonuclease R [Shiella aurantiaca]
MPKKHRKGGEKSSKHSSPNTSKPTLPPQNLEQQVLRMFNSQPGQSFSIKGVIKKLGVRDKHSKDSIPRILFDLEDTEKIVRLSNGHFTSTKESAYAEGVVDFVNSRFAYIIVAGMDIDTVVTAENLNNALDGDRVKVKIFGTYRKTKHPEGEVVEILQRARTEFVGKIELSPNYAFVVADNKKMHQDIFVNLKDTLGAENHDKVVVSITRWPDATRNPEGKVVRVLGKAGEHNAEIHSIMAEFGLPFDFPETVVAESETISERISDKEISSRRDFRKVTTFTIDPEDAKDFDDALSIEKTADGLWEIGVHIADVTHYVKEKTKLEEEAFQRATSVYLVDRTIPMLPERLSNDLCSLRPNEDKLTFSAVFVLDENAKIQKEWFGRTIIHSDRRFTYEEAQERIETKTGDFAEEILTLNALALKLRKERYAKGAINFETVEVKFKLDEKGKPLAVVPKIRKDAHKLIEEFMLLANKRVAEFIFNMKKEPERNTFIYRTHDLPNAEKLQSFSVFAKKFGYELNLEEGKVSRSLNQLVDAIEGRPEQNVLQSLAVRSMAKAKYTTSADPHFGLAFTHYSHFTSPIRRYPDMMAHRLLQHYLDKGKSVSKEEYEEKCVHSSEREKRAADAERASIKFKQVEFMRDAEDKAYEGIVSGVTEWGVYVEIVETKCEGMIRMVDITDDYYEFDEANYRIIGRQNKRIITLGDSLQVRVKATDIDKRTIDLIFADQKNDTRAKKATGKRR